MQDGGESGRVHSICECDKGAVYTEYYMSTPFPIDLVQICIKLWFLLKKLKKLDEFFHFFPHFIFHFHFFSQIMTSCKLSVHLIFECIFQYYLFLLSSQERTHAAFKEALEKLQFPTINNTPLPAVSAAMLRYGELHPKNDKKRNAGSR